MSETKSIPRMHGDEPDCSYITAEIWQYSPYARG